MDAIEILGSLLGHKSSGGGAGADILKEILLGGSRREAQSPSGSTQTRPAQPRTAPSPRELPAESIEQQARELEDLLNVANDRTSRRPSAQPESPSRPTGPRQSVEQPIDRLDWYGVLGCARYREVWRRSDID